MLSRPYNLSYVTNYLYALRRPGTADQVSCFEMSPNSLCTILIDMVVSGMNVKPMKTWDRFGLWYGVAPMWLTQPHFVLCKEGPLNNFYLDSIMPPIVVPFSRRVCRPFVFLYEYTPTHCTWIFNTHLQQHTRASNESKPFPHWTRLAHYREEFALTTAVTAGVKIPSNSINAVYLFE